MTCIYLRKSIAWLNTVLQQGILCFMYDFITPGFVCVDTGYATHIELVYLLHGGMQSLIFKDIVNF